MVKILNWFTSIYKEIGKLPLPVTIIIASVVLGSFYYLAEAKKLAFIEKIKTEEKEAVKNALQESKVALNSCLNGAKSIYIDEWFGGCKDRGLLSEKCANLRKMSEDEARKFYKNDFVKMWKYNSDEDFVKRQSDCLTNLPGEIASTLEKRYQNRKDECYKKNPQK